MRRGLSWRQAVSELQADRIVRLEIHEERLRGYNLRRSGAPVSLSCWRGRSGRRYVVQVHPLGTDWPVRSGAGLAFAVARDENGQASIVALAPEGAGAAWLGRMERAGARELHIHLLVDDAAGRAAVALDLGFGLITNS